MLCEGCGCLMQVVAVEGAEQPTQAVVVRAQRRSSAQTASSCTARSRLSSAPSGAGMFSDVVTTRRPSELAAAHCT